MKKLISMLFGLLYLGNIFAYEGILTGQKDLKLIKTEFFDIIYTPDSEKAAAVIAEHADDIYRELHNTYKLIHNFRTPVTITSSQDMYNAYFTHAPYNRIVLYDTQAFIDMAVFKEDLLMTFRHELTHAITYNIKTPFWLGVSKIFGTLVSPNSLIATSGQAEGVAIVEESRYGEGRLNNEFARHFVKQAKIEDKFPNHGETTGARDIYIYDYNYKFGGEFTDYIRKTYGEEKLAEYWKRMTNLKGLTYFSVFNSVYKVSLPTAWKNFKASIEVPNVPADPTKSGTVFRFDSSKDYEQFSYLASAKDKLVYYNDNSKSFYLMQKDLSSPTGYTKPKRVLNQNNIVNMSLSPDGRYLTYSYLSTAGTLPKNKLKIYDFKTRSSFSVPEKKLNDGIVFTINQEGGETSYLAAAKNISQDSSINIFRLIKNKNDKIVDVELIETVNNRFNNFSTNLQADNKGSIYYLSKEGVGYIIKSYNFLTKIHQQYNLPHEDMLIQNLTIYPTQEESVQAYFSYVQPGTMPRLGTAKLDSTTAEYTLYEQDFSGGIFAPVTSVDNKIIYIGKFMSGNYLYTTDITTMASSRIPVQTTDLGVRSKEENNSIASIDTSILKDAKDFSIWPYLIKGSWYPLSNATSYGISGNLGRLEAFSSILGVTFMGITPWGSPNYTLSAAYNIGANSGIFQTGISGGTETSLFKYSMQNNLEVDGKGYKQTYHNIGLSSSIPLHSMLTLQLTNTLELFEGRLTFRDTVNKHNTLSFFQTLKATAANFFFTRNIASLSVTYTPWRGRGRFQILSFSANTFVDTAYMADITNFKAPITDYNNLGLGVQIHIPQLLPLSPLTWGTWNLPLSLSATLYPSQGYFLQTRGNLVLFSFELQKAYDVFPIIFFNRVTAEIEYLSKFSNGKNSSWAITNMPSHLKGLGEGKMIYTDELITRMALTLSPNLGNASRIHPKLNFDFKYRFFPEKGESPFAFNLGFAVSL